MGFSYTAKNSILNAMTGRSQNASLAATCMIGVGVMEGDVFTEPDTTTGYSRTLLGNYQSADSKCMGEPVQGNIRNTKIIYLPEAVADWGTVTHFGLFSSGRPLLRVSPSIGVMARAVSAVLEQEAPIFLLPTPFRLVTMLFALRWLRVASSLWVKQIRTTAWSVMLAAQIVPMFRPGIRCKKRKLISGIRRFFLPPFVCALD